MSDGVLNDVASQIKFPTDFVEGASPQQRQGIYTDTNGCANERATDESFVLPVDPSVTHIAIQADGNHLWDTKKFRYFIN